MARCEWAMLLIVGGFHKSVYIGSDGNELVKSVVVCEHNDAM